MKLFVYGTLKKGGMYHHYLNSAKRIATAATVGGTLYDTGLGYPAMRLEGKGMVTGEIYEVPEHLWPKLDELEDCTGQPDDLYEKVTVNARAAGDVQMTVVYVAKGNELLKTIIEDGIWRI